MSSKIKAGVIKMAQDLWASDTFRLLDNVRTRRLRKDILRKLLALVMTDDERAEMLGFSEGSRIRESAKVIAPEKLICGEHVWIGENVVLDASGGLEIGSHTTIAVGSLVWTHSSVLSNIMMDNKVGNQWIVRKPTKIGSGCYIGGPSSIYPGVTIGNKVIVLPMSVVTEDMPDNVMVGGSPARVIRKIDDEWISKYCHKSDI